MNAIAPRQSALLLLAAKLRVAATRNNTPIHAAADAHYKPMFLTVMAAFMRGRKAYRSGGVNAAVKAIRASLLEGLPPALLKCLAAGGVAGLARLRTYDARAASALRSLTPDLKMKFDASNKAAADWVLSHATKIADDISQTSKDSIALAVARAQEEGGLREQYDDILGAVGNETRADMIARTESMTAANEGNRQAWDQAVGAGLLTGDEQRVWIATSGACDDCEELDGETADLDGEYPYDGGDGPPLHPNCRCTEGISAAVVS